MVNEIIVPVKPTHAFTHKYPKVSASSFLCLIMMGSYLCFLTVKFLGWILGKVKINVMIDKKRGLWYNKYYFSENKSSFAHRRHGFINERLVKNNERN